MTIAADLKAIVTEARPLIEGWLDISEQMSALREVATEKGLDWSQIKAIVKAAVQDERDGTSEGKRVKRIIEKADFASSYADMLGLVKMNENIFSDAAIEPEAPITKVEPTAPEIVSHSDSDLEVPDFLRRAS